jgi:aspartate racemase
VRTQKLIGLIGGLSWESSAVYYRLINTAVQERLGGVASARCLLWSFDFAQIEALQTEGDWVAAARLMVAAALNLESAGADFLIICSNTMHRSAAEIEAVATIPLLHIADPTGLAIQKAGLKRVGLLGTAFTMEQDFYKARLAAKYGLEVLVPGASDRARVHAVIFEELVRGVIKSSSRLALEEVIAALVAQGAQAVVLGCTELMLLISSSDSSVPLFDTTALHAQAAVSNALAPLEGRLG